MSTLKCFVAPTLLASLCTGCSGYIEDYKSTVRDGIKTVPHVQEIKRIFSNAPTDYFITNYGFDKDKPKQWNTVVYFGGRYTFTYQVDVVVDYKNNRVGKVVGKPQFYLEEVVKVLDASSDSVGADYKHPGDTLDEDKWNKLVAAHGNFSVIGITLNTNAPVQGFDEYVHAWRKERIQVEP